MSVRRYYGQKQAGPRRARVFRPVLLAAVFAAVVWAFMANNQRRFAFLVAQGLFSDETQSVPEELRDQAVELLKKFKQEFGVTLEVHVRKEPPPITAHDASRMYIDIVPSRERAYLTLPPLVRNAVGREFIRDMERSFAQDFAAGDWRPGLLPAIAVLRNKLAEVTR